MLRRVNSSMHPCNNNSNDDDCHDDVDDGCARVYGDTHDDDDVFSETENVHQCQESKLQNLRLHQQHMQEEITRLLEQHYTVNLKNRLHKKQHQQTNPKNRPCDASRAKGRTRTASFWFGEGASKNKTLLPLADFTSLVLGVGGCLMALLFCEVSLGINPSGLDPNVSLNLLFDSIIPALSGLAAAIGVLLLFRAGLKHVHELSERLPTLQNQQQRAQDDQSLNTNQQSLKSNLNREIGSSQIELLQDGQTYPELGRKSLLVVTSCLLFCLSCFYRAINIADEGAAMCRGHPSVWNAPVAGRTVATIGEVALVVQLTIFVEDAAYRLKASRGIWSTVFTRYTRIPFSTIGPVLLAEVMSWSGVLSGNSKFYCAEYVLWMIVAFSWAWDGAELLHKSTRWQDEVVMAGLVICGTGLFFFNALLEIPHFFAYSRQNTPAHNAAGIWECVQSRESPLWTKRLPFFVCYFVGAAWCAVAVAYRFTRNVRLMRQQVVSTLLSSHP